VMGFLISIPISYGFFRLCADRMIVRKLLSRIPQPSQQAPAGTPGEGAPVGSAVGTWPLT